MYEEDYQKTLYEILKHVVKNIVSDIHPYKNDLFWDVIREQITDLLVKYRNSQDDNLLQTLGLYFKLIGQCIEYKQGRFLQKPTPLIEIISNMLNEMTLPESILLTIIRVVVLILTSKNLNLSQEQAALLTRKILSNAYEKVFLFFVENIIDYSSFEALILPNFLRYCLQNDLDARCFHVLVKIILRKSPLCGVGFKLQEWVRYPIDFKEYNPMVIDILSKFLNFDALESTDAIDNYLCSIICLPHVVTKPKDELLDILEKRIIDLSTLVKESVQTALNAEIKKILMLINFSVECFIHLFDHSKLSKMFLDEILPALLPLVSDPNYIDSLKTISLCIGALHDCPDIITIELLKNINAVLEINFSSPFHEVSANIDIFI